MEKFNEVLDLRKNTTIGSDIKRIVIDNDFKLLKDRDPLSRFYLSFRLSPSNPNFMIVSGCLIEKESKTLIIADSSCIDIPEEVKIIGYCAFNHQNVHTITLPYSIKEIKDFAFENGGFSFIKLNKGLIKLGNHVFDKCSYLKGIEISETLTDIGNLNEASLPSLDYIKVSELNPIYDSRDNCNGLINTNSNTLIKGGALTSIPNSITTIGKKCFYGLNKGNAVSVSLIIPKNVTYIDDNAFSNTFFASVIIPFKETKISKKAFKNTKVFSLTMPFIDPDSLLNCNIRQALAFGWLKVMDEDMEFDTRYLNKYMNILFYELGHGYSFSSFSNNCFDFIKKHGYYNQFNKVVVNHFYNACLLSKKENFDILEYEELDYILLNNIITPSLKELVLDFLYKKTDKEKYTDLIIKLEKSNPIDLNATLLNDDPFSLTLNENEIDEELKKTFESIEQNYTFKKTKLGYRLIKYIGKNNKVKIPTSNDKVKLSFEKNVYLNTEADTLIIPNTYKGIDLVSNSINTLILEEGIEKIYYESLCHDSLIKVIIPSTLKDIIYPLDNKQLDTLNLNYKDEKYINHLIEFEINEYNKYFIYIKKANMLYNKFNKRLYTCTDLSSIPLDCLEIMPYAFTYLMNGYDYYSYPNAVISGKIPESIKIIHHNVAFPIKLDETDPRITLPKNLIHIGECGLYIKDNVNEFCFEINQKLANFSLKIFYNYYRSCCPYGFAMARAYNAYLVKFKVDKLNPYFSDGDGAGVLINKQNNTLLYAPKNIEFWPSNYQFIDDDILIFDEPYPLKKRKLVKEIYIPDKSLDENNNLKPSISDYSILPRFKKLSLPGDEIELKINLYIDNSAIIYVRPGNTKTINFNICVEYAYKRYVTIYLPDNVKNINLINNKVLYHTEIQHKSLFLFKVNKSNKELINKLKSKGLNYTFID